ncbi:MAG: gliding motility-associated C-terminal domain-containing protein [Bacteroidota bacterium]
MKKYLLPFILVLPFYFFAQTNITHTPQQLKEKEVELKKNVSGNKKTEILPPFNKIITIGSKEYDLVKANGTLSKYKTKNKVATSTPIVTYHYAAKVTTSTLTPCDPIGVSNTAAEPFPVTVDDDTYQNEYGSQLQLPFTFCFYGNSYTQVNYSTNGNIQLGTTNVTAFSSVGFPVTNTLMIAPFWADLDNRGVGQYLIDVYPTYAVFTWTNCGYYNSKTNKTNSFQLVITDGLDPILPLGKNVGFYYYDMQWTTGDVSGGTNGFPTTQPGTPATVGVNAGNGMDFIQLGRFGLPGSFYDGPGGGNDGVDWLDNKKFYFDLCPSTGTNIDPQPTLISCDTLKVCGDDVLTVTNSFLAPEVGQNVNITVSAPTLGSSLSYTVVPNSGSSALVMAIDGLTAVNGYHTITITATDDGTPPLTVTQELIVSVNETVPTASILGNLSYCLPSEVSTVLTATNVSTIPNQAPLTYSWSGTGTLSSTSSDVVTVNDGVYTVTITNKFGCPGVATVTVVEGETPKYTLISNNAISGGSVYCVNQDSARIAISFGSGAPTACGLAISPCVSSNTIQIGTGTSTGSGTGYTPYNGVWESSHHQYLYRASELLAAGIQPGKLSSIAFNITNLNGGNTSYSNFAIKLKCTSSTVLTSASMDVTGLSQVFNVGVLNVATGWNTHNFSQAYEWDGISNLLVDVCYYDPNWEGNNIVQYTNVGYNAVRNDYDLNDICGTTSAVGVSPNRPNTIFGNCMSQQSGSQFNVVVTPTTGVVIPIANDSIKIKLPSTPGTTCYTVSLVNPLGNCSKDTVICVQAVQGITQGSLVASSYSVCPTETLTLSAVGSLTSYTIQYTDNMGAGSIANNSITISAPSITGAYTYTLLATGPCGGTLTAFTNTVNVISGVTNATLSLSSNSVCPGTPITLSTIGVVLPTYTISYVDGSGLQTSVGNSVTVTPTVTVPGTYQTYTLTAQGFCGGPITNFIDSVQIYTGVSQATLTASADTLCPGFPLTVSHIGNLTTFTVTYSDASGINTSTTVPVTYTPTGLTNPTFGYVTYTLTGQGPCSAPVTSFVDSVFIKQGVTEGTLTASQTTGICAGSSITLSVTQNPLNPLATYTIQYNTGSGVQSSTTSVTFAPTNTTSPVFGGHTYTLIAQGGCSALMNTSFLTVTVSPGIAPPISLAATPSVICIGSPVTLSVTSIGAPYSTYTISYMDATGPHVSSGSPTFTPNISGINTYSVLADGFCSSPQTFTTAVVNVAALATLSIAPMPNQTKCLNSSVTLSANVASSFAAPYSYNWSPAVGTSTNSTYVTSTPVTSTFVVTVNGTCANTATASVVVNNFATNINVLILDSASVCGSTEFELHTLISGGKSPYNFNWTILPDNNSIGSNQNLASLAPSSQGVYTVSVVSIDSCGFSAFDTQLINVLPPCGIEIGNVITPNNDGVNDFFKIKNIEYHPNSVLTIYDRWGRKVYENSNYANDWKGEGSNDGTYFYILDVPQDKKYNGFVQIIR